MKYIYILFAFLLFSPVANAAQCKLPKNCTYMDSEFSTGGGDKVSYVMEVTCKMPNGSMAKYISWKVSVGSLFGVGRFTAPKKISFVKGVTDELMCKF